MNNKKLKKLMTDVAKGKVSMKEAEKEFKTKTKFTGGNKKWIITLAEQSQ